MTELICSDYEFDHTAALPMNIAGYDWQIQFDFDLDGTREGSTQHDQLHLHANYMYITGG